MILTPEQKRKAMASNRGRTNPELKLAKALWAEGLRYLTIDGFVRRYGLKLPGKPDLIFTAQRVVVFLDGCFWHGCPACRGIPLHSGEFWRSKIERNRVRDQRVDQELGAQGWTVVRVWEHEVSSRQKLTDVASRLRRQLRKHVTEEGKHPEVLNKI